MSSETHWLVASGVATIRAVQQLQNPVSDFIFGTFTFMGQEVFFLLFLPLVWVALGWGAGARVSALLVLSTLINIWIKDWVQFPRPFETFRDVFVYAAGGYSFPSGHAQVGFTFWVSLALEIQDKRFTRLVPLIIFMIGLSRIYYGVHYPIDVLVGWVIGFILVRLYRRWLAASKLQLEGWPVWAHFFFAAVIPSVLAWIHTTDASVAICGASAGLGLGMLLCHHYLGYNPHPRHHYKLAAYAISLAGTALIYLGLKRVLPDDFLWHYLRYLVVGAWVSGGALWVAQKFSLSDHQSLPRFSS